jgi:hypothetical protein
MDVKDFKDQFEAWKNATIEARAASERDQDYDDHHQWTDAEVQKLTARNQAPVVINRVKTKVNLLTGIQTMRRTMPRALPRTPKHEEAADAATEALRFVIQNTVFEMKSSAVFRDKCVPGYGGVIIEKEERGGETWVAITKIPWDRYYFDPFSRELDFSDKNYDGIVLWMDKKDVIETFPDKEKDIDLLMTSESGNDTDDDKPIWIDRKRDRIKVCQHFYKDGGWKMCYFTENLHLTDPADSPFLDEFGEPQNPIEMETAYIDRELNRYGEARSYIWLQDEINHRRSRLLYAGSVSRTMGEDGAVDDVTVMKQEMAKADGHIKVNPGFSEKFQVLPNDAISETQLLLYRESKQEIDELGANAALAGKGNARSGRQDQIQQQAGIAELASLYDGHRDWENRVYRQVWNRIKQYWTAEKWIRVTDDKTDLEWVGLNQPITAGQMLQEAAQAGDPNAQAGLQQMIAMQDPRLNEVVRVENNVAEMDVDIIIADAPNHTTLRQETFETMMALAERYGPENVPFTVALELSDLPNKKEAKALLNPPVDPEAQAKQQQLQELMISLDIQDKQVKIKATEAKATRDMVETEAQMIENEIVKSGFGNLVADRDADTTAKHLDNIQKQVETLKLAQEPNVSASVSV